MLEHLNRISSFHRDLAQAALVRQHVRNGGTKNAAEEIPPAGTFQRVALDPQTASSGLIKLQDAYNAAAGNLEKHIRTRKAKSRQAAAADHKAAAFYEAAGAFKNEHSPARARLLREYAYHSEIRSKLLAETNILLNAETELRNAFRVKASALRSTAALELVASKALKRNGAISNDLISKTKHDQAVKRYLTAITPNG